MRKPTPPVVEIARYDPRLAPGDPFPPAGLGGWRWRDVARYAPRAKQLGCRVNWPLIRRWCAVAPDADVYETLNAEEDRWAVQDRRRRVKRGLRRLEHRACRRSRVHAPPIIGWGLDSEDAHGGDEAVGDVPDSVSGGGREPQDGAAVGAGAPGAGEPASGTTAAQSAVGGAFAEPNGVAPSQGGDDKATEAGGAPSAEDPGASRTQGGQDGQTGAAESADGMGQRGSSPTAESGTPLGAAGPNGHDARGGDRAEGRRPATPGCGASGGGEPSLAPASAYQAGLSWAESHVSLERRDPTAVRAIARDLQLLVQRLDQGLDGVQCPRLDAARVAQEVVARRYQIQRATVRVRKPVVWFAVDWSGSMTPVVGEFCLAALMLARTLRGQFDVVLAGHCNGGLESVQHPNGMVEGAFYTPGGRQDVRPGRLFPSRKRYAWFGDADSVALWHALWRLHEPDIIVLLADDDGLRVYRQWGIEKPDVLGRMVQLHPHGGTYGVADARKTRLAPRPWRCIAGVVNIQSIRAALQLAAKGGLK